MTVPELLTEEQAAERLLLHPRTLRKLRQAGAICYVALTSRKIAYRPEDLQEFVASRVRQEQSPVPTHRITSRRSTVIGFTERRRLRKFSDSLGHSEQ